MMAMFRNRPMRERILSGEHGDTARRTLLAERRRVAKAFAAERKAGQLPKTLRKSVLAQMADGKIRGSDTEAAASTDVGQAQPTKGTSDRATGFLLDRSKESDNPK